MRRQVHAREAQGVSVLHHVDERDNAGPALRGVEPVTSPRVIGNVGFALIPNINAVEAVVEDRNPDKEQLQQKNEGQAVQKLDLLSIGQWAFESFGVRDEVFEEEGSNGYNATQGMQTAQQKRDALAGAQWSDTRFDLWSGSDGTAS